MRSDASDTRPHSWYGHRNESLLIGKIQSRPRGVRDITRVDSHGRSRHRRRMNDAFKPCPAARRQHGMPDRNRRLLPGLLFDFRTRSSLDHAGDAAPHDPEAVRRIDDDLDVDLQNAAVHDLNCYASFGHRVTTHP